MNPAYKEFQARKAGTAQPSAPPLPNAQQALPIVSNMGDHDAFNAANVAAGMPPADVAESTSAMIELAQESDLVEAVGVDPNEWVDELGAVFAKLEIPIGLMNKLLDFKDFKLLNFVIDDSGSMTSLTKANIPTSTTRYIFNVKKQPIDHIQFKPCI